MYDLKYFLQKFILGKLEPIKPRNINWQDWKYTSFVVFIRHSQNIRRHNEFSEYRLYGRRRW